MTSSREPMTPIGLPLATPRTRPRLMLAALLATDLAAVCCAVAIAIGGRWLANGQLTQEQIASLWLVPPMFAVAYAVMGLYPAVALSPAEELRRATLTTTMVFLLFSTAVFLAKHGHLFSRGAFVAGWAVSLVLVPLFRSTLRSSCARRAWWGYPAVVLADPGEAARVIDRLQRFPSLGLKPIAVLSDDAGEAGAVAGVPLLGRLSVTPSLGRSLHVPYAIVSMPGAPPERLLGLIDRYGKIFSHLIVVPDLFGATSMWMSARDLGGLLGLEVKQRLLLPGPRLRKRAFDLVLATLITVIALPAIAALAAVVRLTSRGPAFYGHTRIGQGGRRFTAWKFRSMIADADAVLARHLDAHPELREEWQRDHKLREDPRITRVGGWLRRTSLDEVPQLVNVLRGEMSLVGPRPIVQAEVDRYDDSFHLYGKLKPGMTGLWQVSGRNDTTYEQRVAFDAYYARNWTVWLDLHILARTVLVVLGGRGAY